MNYKKHYTKLIETRRKMNRCKDDGVYYEDHHILPKSLGGTDEKFNMILLTAKEHWIAHLLLMKLVNLESHKHSMSQAVKRMCGKQVRHKMNGKMYESAKKIHSDITSKKFKNTIIVKDSETGIMIGHVPKDHPKYLSGEWVFFHTGMKRSDEWKLKVGNTVAGVNNGTFTGMTNDDIMNRSVELYEKFGYWTINLLRFYCDYMYDEVVPKSYNGKYRKGLLDNIVNKLTEMGATKKQLGQYAKHHTNRIKEEIKNGN